MPVKTIRQALQAALAHEMRRDPTVVVSARMYPAAPGPKVAVMPPAAYSALPRD